MKPFFGVSRRRNSTSGETKGWYAQGEKQKRKLLELTSLVDSRNQTIPSYLVPSGTEQVVEDVSGEASGGAWPKALTISISHDAEDSFMISEQIDQSSNDESRVALQVASTELINGPLWVRCVSGFNIADFTTTSASFLSESSGFWKIVRPRVRFRWN